MQEMIEQGAITVQRSEYWIEMNSSVLFDSGSSTLYPRVVPILTELGRVMMDFSNHVHVEGYTNTVPINTEMFPSNWELSGVGRQRWCGFLSLLESKRTDLLRLAMESFIP